MLKKRKESCLSYSKYGETLLTDEDIKGLKLTNIKTKRELAIAENKNIQKAYDSLVGPLLSPDIILDDLWLRDLHRLMFEDVWEWAGQYRITETNIGDVHPAHVATGLLNTCKNAKMWLEYMTFPTIIEIIIRFYHVVLKIHPFRNGNGRWARIACSCLANTRDLEIDWQPLSVEENKNQYINALKIADNRDKYDELISIMSPLFSLC